MDAARKVRKPRFLSLLILSLFSLSFMVYVLFVFPPGSSLIAGPIAIPYLLIFFLLLSLTVYGLTAFFLKSGLQGILVAGLVVSFLLLRVFNITHPFFTLLLLVLFSSIEGIVWKRK